MTKFTFIKRGQYTWASLYPSHFSLTFSLPLSLSNFEASAPSVSFLYPSCYTFNRFKKENDQNRACISSYQPFASRAQDHVAISPIRLYRAFTLQRVPSVLQRVTCKYVFIYVASPPAFPESISLLFSCQRLRSARASTRSRKRDYRAKRSSSAFSF